VEDAFAAIQASREGIEVGNLYDGLRRFALRVIYPPATPTATSLSELFVSSRTGALVPMGSIASLSEGDGVAAVRHKNRERALRVDVNLRGRDLVSWVAEAQQLIGKEVSTPTGYRVEWGGQFENLSAASKRLAVAVPMALALIFVILYLAFGELKLSLMIYLNVPFAAVGGIFLLALRGMPFSISAAIGFIALFGIAVLNGVVLLTSVKKLRDEGQPPAEAARLAAESRLRAVVMTATVAALGFFPMALSSSAGAEVQRPLATVVIGGLVTATLLTLLVLPAVYSLVSKPRAA
jgi:cobalt-zinc-cadmium resistance protein CzcA